MHVLLDILIIVNMTSYLNNHGFILARINQNMNELSHFLVQALVVFGSSFKWLRRRLIAHIHSFLKTQLHFICKLNEFGVWICQCDMPDMVA